MRKSKNIGKVIMRSWGVISASISALADGKVTAKELERVLKAIRRALYQLDLDVHGMDWLEDVDLAELAEELLELVNELGPLLEHVSIADFLADLEERAQEVPDELLVGHLPEVRRQREPRPEDYPWFTPELFKGSDRDWARAIARWAIAHGGTAGEVLERFQADCAAMLLPWELAGEELDRAWNELDGTVP